MLGIVCHIATLGCLWHIGTMGYVCHISKFTNVSHIMTLGYLCDIVTTRHMFVILRHFEIFHTL
jgi:hypothetical protein